MMIFKARALQQTPIVMAMDVLTHSVTRHSVTPCPHVRVYQVVAESERRRWADEELEQEDQRRKEFSERARLECLYVRSAMEEEMAKVAAMNIKFLIILLSNRPSYDFAATASCDGEMLFWPLFVPDLWLPQR